MDSSDIRGNGRRSGFALAVGVVLALAACAPAASPAAAPAPAPAPAAAPVAAPLQTLVEAARREGSLSLVWGQGSMGGSEGMVRLAQGFNRQYGLNVDVQFTPGPSMPNMAARLAEEYRAGRQAATDVMLGYAQHMLILIDAGALEPEAWASWAPNVQNPHSVEADGRVVTHQTSMAGITYNSSRLTGSAIPKTMADLLKPQYKGRIASTPYAASFDNLAVPELWGEQRTSEFLQQFADQIAGLIRCNEMDRIASGEYDALAIQCSQGEPLQWKARGAPIDFVIAADAPLILPLYLTVPKLSAHPNAAKLWINYLLSREAQDILYEANFSDAAFIPGSRTAPDIEKLQASGVQFTTVDVAFYQRNDEKDMARMLAKFQDILRKQR